MLGFRPDSRRPASLTSAHQDQLHTPHNSHFSQDRGGFYDYTPDHVSSYSAPFHRDVFHTPCPVSAYSMQNTPQPSPSGVNLATRFSVYDENVRMESFASNRQSAAAQQIASSLSCDFKTPLPAYSNVSFNRNNTPCVQSNSVKLEPCSIQVEPKESEKKEDEELNLELSASEVSKTEPAGFIELSSPQLSRFRTPNILRKSKSRRRRSEAPNISSVTLDDEDESPSLSFIKTPRTTDRQCSTPMFSSTPATGLLASSKPSGKDTSTMSTPLRAAFKAIDNDMANITTPSPLKKALQETFDDSCRKSSSVRRQLVQHNDEENILDSLATHNSSSGMFSGIATSSCEENLLPRVTADSLMSVSQNDTPSKSLLDHHSGADMLLSPLYLAKEENFMPPSNDENFQPRSLFM